MNKTVPLWFPFALALFIAFFGTTFFPKLHLLAFAPFLAIVYMRKSYLFSLWIAVLCGLVIDLLSSESPFGLNALNYTLATLFLYKQKRHFFDDKSLSIPLYTMLVSFAVSFVQIFLLFVFSRKLPLSWKMTLSDLFAMPIVDALYAFFWFTSLAKFYIHVEKVGWRRALLLKESEAEN